MSTGRHGRVTLVWRARSTRWVGGWVGHKTGLIAVETRKYSTSGIKPSFPCRPAPCLFTVMAEVWFKLVQFRLVHCEIVISLFLLQWRVKLVGQTVLSERDQMLLSEAESCLLVSSYVRQQFDEVDDRWEQKKQRNARGVPYNRGTPPSLGRRWSALRGANRA
jgi:hypothetical protein